jgi:hypothetical protein
LETQIQVLQPQYDSQFEFSEAIDMGQDIKRYIPIKSGSACECGVSIEPLVVDESIGLARQPKSHQALRLVEKKALGSPACLAWRWPTSGLG